jgi:hypothetical protein
VRLAHVQQAAMATDQLLSQASWVMADRPEQFAPAAIFEQHSMVPHHNQERFGPSDGHLSRGKA